MFYEVVFYLLILFPTQGEKEKNIKDVHDFNLTIPMLVYHNMTWTWHDLAMAVQRDCKRTLLSQVSHRIRCMCLTLFTIYLCHTIP